MDNPKLLLLLTIIGCTLIAFPAKGQHTLSTKSITISIVNKRFDNAIKQIQEESKINLCYNSDIIPKNKIVTIKAYHNRLDKVLVPLLASVNLQMKEINDQIIITKASNIAPEEIKTSTLKNSGTNPQKTEITGKIVTILDTVYYTVHDTVVKTIYDTIKITVYDTKVIKLMNKPVTPWNPQFSLDLSCGMLYQITKNLAYSTNSTYHSFFEPYGSSAKNEQGYSIGSNFSIRNKRLALSGGIEFFKLTSTLNKSDVPKSLDKIDSTIVSISIKPNGIFYTYKVDTTTLEITYNPDRATLTNSYIYMGFPVSLSYKVVQTNNIEVGLSLGILYSRLISSKGFDANLSNGNPLFKNSGGESMIRDNLSFTAGFEIDYPLSDRISLEAICRFRKNVTSRYQKSFPIMEKPSYIYPVIAIKYTF